MRRQRFPLRGKLGFLKKEHEIVLTSQEMSHLSDQELKDKIPLLRVVARALPQDKSRLVRLSEEMGLVVGMDGGWSE